MSGHLDKNVRSFCFKRTDEYTKTCSCFFKYKHHKLILFIKKANILCSFFYDTGV